MKTLDVHIMNFTGIILLPRKTFVLCKGSTLLLYILNRYVYAWRGKGSILRVTASRVRTSREKENQEPLTVISNT